MRMLTPAATILCLLLNSPAIGQAQAPPAGRAAAAVEAWRTIVADWEQFERAESPVTAGMEGDREALRRLPDITPGGDARRLAALRTFQARIAGMDRSLLPAEDAFNHRFLGSVVEERVEQDRFDGARLAFDAEGGPGSVLGYLARVTSVSSAEDAEAWLARLAAVASLYAAATENGRRGIATGFTQPRSTVESALQVARAEAALTLAEEPLLIPLRRLPESMPAARQAALKDQAARIITEQVVPARNAWVRFLETEYLPAARPGLGLGSLPGGRDYYAFLARSYTTTPMTPDQIHDVGLAEVARIRTAMDAEMAATGFTGSFPEFLQWLRTDPRFYAQTRDELLMHAREISKRADDVIPALFRNSLPRLPYGVRPVPQEIEDQYTTGRYFRGSLQLGVAGGYLVNTGRLDQRPLYELPALTVHEAVPGHHLQIAIAQELGEQPWFRRHASVTAFSEGWGLYAEFLGEEMGIYRDPFERFGRLSYEMWRACRLVVDTGIHWKGWGIEQARACFRDNSALAPHNIETELQRYIGWPGQALAYKIGELKLKELRAESRRVLGDRFDVREFHDTVLMGGALPLALLEERVRAWQQERLARR
jgi:uncharacterized protein (DUF885 family)